MKQLIAVLLTVFGLMFATSVVAETYTVQAGDTLGKIAKRYQGVGWQDIYLTNQQKIKNPDRIYPGQKLDIPTVKKSQKQYHRQRGDIIVSTLPVYFYKKPDSNPVGKGTDPTPYIQKANLPKEVEKQFIFWALNGDKDSQEAVITAEGNPQVQSDKTVFSRLDTMGYGHQGKVVRNVKVMFNDIRPAKYWQMDYQGVRYYLICDQKCYNWSTFSIKALIKSLKKKTKVVQTVAKRQATNFTPPKSSRHKISPAVEAWLYGGVSKGVEGNVGDTGKYYGISISAWMDKWQIGNGSFRIGPSYQYVGWDGTAGNVDYDGHFNLFGAEGQYLTNTTKDQLKVLSGKKHGHVYGNGFPYYAYETADIVALEGAHQWWNTAKNYEGEVGFRAEIAYNNDKSSTWEDHIIPHKDDPALDQSMYSVRGKYTYTKYPNCMPTAELSGSYRQANYSKAIQLRTGLKLWNEIIEPSVHYERGFVDGDQTGTIGANINIDLSKLGKKVFAWLRDSKQSKKSLKAQPAKVSQKAVVASLTDASPDYDDF